MIADSLVMIASYYQYEQLQKLFVQMVLQQKMEELELPSDPYSMIGRERGDGFVLQTTIWISDFLSK